MAMRTRTLMETSNRFMWNFCIRIDTVCWVIKIPLNTLCTSIKGHLFTCGKSRKHPTNTCFFKTFVTAYPVDQCIQPTIWWLLCIPHEQAHRCICIHIYRLILAGKGTIYFSLHRKHSSMSLHDQLSNSHPHCPPTHPTLSHFSSFYLMILKISTGMYS